MKIVFDWKKENYMYEEYSEMDEVRVKTFGGAIGTIERVIYEIINGEETDNINCYEMEINGEHGIIVYPDEIDQ